jgi:hypothetical protein
VSSNPTQLADVHYVQSSANPNGNQQPGGNKKKGCNTRKGGKNGNKTKDNDNNEKTNDNVGEGKRERRKVKFPCKFFTDDHLTRLCPKLAEVTRLLSLPHVVLMNPFPHNQHMASISSNAENAASGSQNPRLQYGNRLCINMVDVKVNVSTLSQDYRSKQDNIGLESPPPPLEMTLHIEKLDLPPRISKGVIKRSTHNPNARAA